MSSTLKPHTESICPGEVQTPSNAIISKCTKPFNISYISFPGNSLIPLFLGPNLWFHHVISCFIPFETMESLHLLPCFDEECSGQQTHRLPEKRRTVTCGGIKTSLVSTDLFHSILLKKNDRRTSKRSNVGKIW